MIVQYATLAPRHTPENGPNFDFVSLSVFK